MKDMKERYGRRRKEPKKGSSFLVLLPTHPPCSNWNALNVK